MLQAGFEYVGFLAEVSIYRLAASLPSSKGHAVDNIVWATQYLSRNASMSLSGHLIVRRALCVLAIAPKRLLNSHFSVVDQKLTAESRGDR